MSRKKRTNPFSLFAFQDVITSVSGIFLLVTLLLAFELSQKIFAIPEVEKVIQAEDFQKMLSEVEKMEQSVQTMRESHEALNEQWKQSIPYTVSQLTKNIKTVETALEESEKQIIQTDSRIQEIEDNREKTEEMVAELEKMKKEVISQKQLLEIIQNKVRSEKKDHYILFHRKKNTSEQPWLTDIRGEKILCLSLGKEENKTFAKSEDFLKWAQTRDADFEYFLLLVRPSGVANYSTIYEKLQQYKYKIGVDLVTENIEIKVVGAK